MSTKCETGDLLLTLPVPRLGWTATATLPADIAMAPAAVFRRDRLIVIGAALILLTCGPALNLRTGRRRLHAQALAADQEEHLRTAQATLRVSELRSR